MSKFSLTITAVVAASASAAAFALPAIGDDGNSAGPGDDNGAALVACLRDNGVQVPDKTGIDLKMWIGEHMSKDSALATALEKCVGSPTEHEKGKDAGVVKRALPSGACADAKAALKKKDAVSKSQ